MAVRADTYPQYPVPWWRGRYTSWLTTVDHKRIGILYLVTCLVFFGAGGVLALLMRTQLAQANEDFLTRDSYNEVMTMHGTAMVFLVVVPILAGFGNFLVPLMIGARDVAFPRLNALSYWLFLFGGVILFASFFADGGAAKTGWTIYAPLSEQAGGNGVDYLILSLHVLSISSLIGAINFVVTIHRLRAPGMTWMRVPLFVWSIEVYAALLIVVLPALSAGLTMLLLDRQAGTHFFDPEKGGSAVLWQHVFWFFGHPEVYIMILPVMGIVSEVIPVFSRKPIFGYTAIVFSTVAIGFFSLLVWAHHMFAVGLANAAARLLHDLVSRDRHPDGREDPELARDDLARQPHLRHADALRARLRRALHDRRPLGDLPGGVPDRLAGDRLVLRRRPPALRALRRLDVRGLRGALLLVAQDLRPDAARGARQAPFLAALHRVQPRVLPAASAWGSPGCHGASTRTATSGSGRRTT